MEGEGVYNVTTSRHPEYVVDAFYNLRSLYGNNLERLKGKSVLDVGSGGTEMARYLDEEFGIANTKQLDWWYDGSSESLSNLAAFTIAKESIPDFLRVNQKYLVAGTAQKSDLPSESFDLITSSHLFRHFNQDHFNTAVDELYRLLKPGGRIIITPISDDVKARKIFETLQRRNIAIQKTQSFSEYKIDGPQISFEITK